MSNHFIEFSVSVETSFQNLFKDFQKKTITPRIVFGNAQFLTEQDRQSPSFVDQDNLPFYYYLGKYFPASSLLSVGFGVGLATSAYCMAFKPQKILAQHYSPEEFYSPRLGKGNLLRIAKRKINVRLGKIENVISKEDGKFDGIILENHITENVFENLEFCIKICNKWICVDRAKSTQIKEAVNKIKKIYNKNAYYAKTRYGNYIIEM